MQPSGNSQVSVARVWRVSHKMTIHPHSLQPHATAGTDALLASVYVSSMYTQKHAMHAHMWHHCNCSAGPHWLAGGMGTLYTFTHATASCIQRACMYITSSVEYQRSDMEHHTLSRQRYSAQLHTSLRALETSSCSVCCTGPGAERTMSQSTHMHRADKAALQ